MTYRTSSPTVKCEKCEERLTDFEAYENHMAHMHGSSPSEESVVDWTLITDEDIITKDGNKYRVGGESINWSPNFDKEAREFLESKYQKDKIEILSKKKIGEAKRFVKALEFDTNKHYDNLIDKIEGKGEDSYNELFPNEKQVFPQNKMPSKKWFSHQKDEAGVTDVIEDQGYFDDPNAVMGSQTKRFSKGKYHIDDPVAKEQFSTSFYGDYLGESIGTESIETEWNNATPEERKKFIINTHNGFVDGHEQDVLSDWSNVHEFTKSILKQKWQFAHDEFTKGQKDFFGLESKAKEVDDYSHDSDGDIDGYTVLDKDGGETPTYWLPYHLSDAKREADRIGGSVVEIPIFGGVLGNTVYRAGESKANEYEEDEYDEETGELLTPSGYDEDEWIDDSDVPKSGHYESWTFTNKHGVDYELDDEDGGLYNDLYYQQIDEGDEQEVFELLDRYNENYPYASKKDMENEIERTIGWVSDDRDIQTLVLQWEDSRYS